MDLMPSGMKSKLESIQASTSSMDTALASGKDDTQARAMVSHSSDCSLCSSSSSSDAAGSARVWSGGVDIFASREEEEELV